MAHSSRFSRISLNFGILIVYLPIVPHSFSLSYTHFLKISHSRTQYLSDSNTRVKLRQSCVSETPTTMQPTSTTTTTTTTQRTQQKRLDTKTASNRNCSDSNFHFLEFFLFRPKTTRKSLFFGVGVNFLNFFGLWAFLGQGLKNTLALPLACKHGLAVVTSKPRLDRKPCQTSLLRRSNTYLSHLATSYSLFVRLSCTCNVEKWTKPNWVIANQS